MSKSHVNKRGFTLIEVMVALAVFALAAAMLMLSDGNSIRQTRYMQEKILAAQIADHHLGVLLAEKRWSEGGQSSRIQEYAGLQWRVRESIRETSIKNFKQVEVEVFIGEGEPEEETVPMSRMVSYLRRFKK